MIAKIVPAPKGGSGRQLGEYVLDLKHQNKHERLGEYALDLKHGGEKVEWAHTVNTGTEDPRLGLEVIEANNAMNTRAHSASRNIHMVISFPPGENPSREQMEQIEGRLVEALGLEKHPRLAAAHHDKDHQHLHVVISRIDPETHKAIHPHREQYRLQREGAAIERDFALTQTRHTENWQQTHERRQERAQEREQQGERTSGFAEATAREQSRKEEAELRRTAQLDRVDGRPATAEDISRQLSERYRAAEEQMWGLKKEAGELKKERTAWSNELHGATRDHADRLQQMSWVAKKAHDLGLKDKDLARYEERQRAAEAKLQELKPISTLQFEAGSDQVRRPDTTTRNITVRDIGRHLSPEYKAAVDRTWEARRERKEWSKEFYPRLEAAYGAAKERGSKIKRINGVRRAFGDRPITSDPQMRALSREINGLKREKASVNAYVKAAERAEAKEFKKIKPQALAVLHDRQEKAEAARETLKFRGKERPLKDRFAAAERELKAAFQEVGAMAATILGHRQQRAGAAREEMQREADRERELRRERERGQDLDRGR